MDSDTELHPRPLSELQEYEKTRLLGAGGFGKVYLVKHTKTRVKCAAKEQKTSKYSREEALIIKKLENHEAKHIVKFIGYFEGKSISVTLTEYLPGGELFRYISSTKYDLTEAKCLAFSKQILLAMKFMHGKGIIHLDLKPENILLVHNLMDNQNDKSLSEALKIIDFGLAKNLGVRTKIPMNMCGTLEFISPEVMRCSHASRASDMWSVGVIMYMMISGGVSPFWSGTEYGTQYHIHRAQLARGGFKHPAFKNVSKSSIDCVSKLLVLEPKSRLTATECLQHKWFGNVSDQSTLKKLETAWLRKYLARRRWKRWFITIKAINRMIKIGESIGNGRKNEALIAHKPSALKTDFLSKYHSPQGSPQNSPKLNNKGQNEKKHSNPIIEANGLSDRLKKLMMQNYGDLGIQ